MSDKLKEEIIYLEQSLFELQEHKQELVTELKKLQDKISSQDEKAFQMESRLAKLKFELKDSRKEEMLPPSFQFDITYIQDYCLEQLPSYIIDQIIKKRFGTDKLILVSQFGSELDPHPIIKLEGDDRYKYYGYAIEHIRRHSCKYCHSIYHSIAECDKLMSKICEVCHKKGHTKYRCTTKVCDLFTQ